MCTVNMTDEEKTSAKAAQKLSTLLADKWAPFSSALGNLAIQLELIFGVPKQETLDVIYNLIEKYWGYERRSKGRISKKI